MPPQQTSGLDDLMRRTAWVWLQTDRQPARLTWQVWDGTACLVLCGGREQPVPDLEAGQPVTVLVRSRETGAIEVSWQAAVDELAPGTADWAAAVELLLRERYNPPAGLAGSAKAWAAQSRVLTLRPR